MSSSSSREPRLSARPLVVFGLGSFQVLAAGAAIAQWDFDRYPLSATGQRIATADFDLDGGLDLAVTSGGQVEVLFNDGAGGFLDPVVWVGGGSRIIVADLNGDFAPDIVTSGGSVFRVILNRGDGSFDDVVEYSARASVVAVASGRIDDDNAIDVAVLTKASSDIRMEWHRNDGVGAFSFVDVIDVTGPGDMGDAKDLVAGDFDLDGDTDFAASTQWDYYSKLMDYSFGVHVITNFGGRSWAVMECSTGGRFGGPPDGLCAGDVDNDGDTDLVCQQYRYDKGETEGAILYNDGAGVFTNPSGRDVFSIRGLDWDRGRTSLNDLDGDGLLEVAVTTADAWSHDSQIRVFRRTAGAEFNEVAFYNPGANLDLRDVRLADVNNDGRHDLLVLSNRPEPAILVTHNAIPLGSRPSLEQGRLVPGAPTEFVVSGLQPGERVDLLYSFGAADHSVGIEPLGGMTLDVVDPVNRIGFAHAGDNGIARITVNVPAQAPRTIVTTQAVVARGSGGERSVKSNFITAPIVE